MKKLNKDTQEQKSLYLIFGNEDYLKKEFCDNFINENIASQHRLMNYNLIEEKPIYVSNIIDLAQTSPFMSDKRLIFVKNSEFFIEGKKNETENLLNFINEIPNYTIILFCEDKVDKRLKIYKEFQKSGYIKEINSFSENDLIKWIEKFFMKYNKRIDRHTCLYLIKYVGQNMQIIRNEIEKLLYYKKNDDIILIQDIDKICIKSLEAKIFDLTKAMGNKNANIALDIYNNLLMNKTLPTTVLYMISRQFRLILQSKYMYKNGYSIKDIADSLLVKEFVVKECLKQSKNFKNMTIINALNDFSETDFNIKIGKVSPEISVEVLIAKYCIT